MKTGLTIFFLVVLLVAGRTQAADITVDGSTCTLFDAITAANNNANEGGCTGSGPYGDDTITLQTDVLLTAFLPEIVSTITIEGQGHTIDGNDDSSVGTVLRISSAGDLTLNQATVTGGNASGGFGYGGGIWIKSGAVTLNGSTVSDNLGGGLGGGISNEINGIVTLNSSTISGNTASGIHALGGGIYNENGTATLTDSTVSDNTASGLAGAYGGGISNSGTLTLTDSTFSGNTASGDSVYGGGIDNYGTITLTDSTVSNNTASGSASAYGGGILNDLAGTVSLTNSTISGNTAGNDGGGIENYGTTTLTNSTVSGNTAHGYGGGIDNWGPNAVLTLHSSLISGNTVIIDGDEIYNSDDPLYTGTVTVDSSNLFGHSGKSSAEALYGFSPGTSDITATSDGTDSTSLSAILDITLADNGGPTMTHALVKGSPAVDLDRECSTNLAEDQRGEPRPLGKGCDAGSFESVYRVSPKAMPWIYMLLL